MILSEFDLKGTLNTIKTKIKNAILGLLNTIDKALDKFKSGRIKSALKSLIAKLKKLLGDTDNIKSESDAKNVAKELQNSKDEFAAMEKFEAVENGIANKDIDGLKETLGTMCYCDRDFSRNMLEDNIKYVESKGIKILEDELSGELVSDKKSNYDDKDFARAVFELKKNFCRERIEDVRKISKALY